MVERQGLLLYPYQAALFDAALTQSADDTQRNRMAETPRTKDALRKLSEHESKQLGFYREVMGKHRTREEIESGKDAAYWKARAENAEQDARRLDWLEQFVDGFANIDRITSVSGRFNGLPSLREAIDVKRAALRRSRG